MVYFKLLLNSKREKNDSIYPVVVRVTYNRKNTSFSTGIRVQKDYWDDRALRVRPNHPNSQVYNKAITDFYSKIQNLAFKLYEEIYFHLKNLRFN